jgi:hypothetical protein
MSSETSSPPRHPRTQAGWSLLLVTAFGWLLAGSGVAQTTPESDVRGLADLDTAASEASAADPRAALGEAIEKLQRISELVPDLETEYESTLQAIFRDIDDVLSTLEPRGKVGGVPHGDRETGDAEGEAPPDGIGDPQFPERGSDEGSEEILVRATSDRAVHSDGISEAFSVEPPKPVGSSEAPRPFTAEGGIHEVVASELENIRRSLEIIGELVARTRPADVATARPEDGPASPESEGSHDASTR